MRRLCVVVVHYLGATFPRSMIADPARRPCAGVAGGGLAAHPARSQGPVSEQRWRALPGVAWMLREYARA